MLGFVLVLFAATFYHSDAIEPTLDTRFVNITVAIGTTAKLPCSVTNLGSHRVLWTDQLSIPLTLMDMRLIDDPRISITRNYVENWILTINDVKCSDAGTYRCSVKTIPVQTKTVELNVYGCKPEQ